MKSVLLLLLSVLSFAFHAASCFQLRMAAARYSRSSGRGSSYSSGRSSSGYRSYSSNRSKGSGYRKTSGSSPRSTWNRKKSSTTTSKKTTTITSSQSTRCYTKSGKPIRNPRAYAATGAPVQNKYGARVKNPTAYCQKTQENNVMAATKAARKANPNAKAFTYTAKLPGGRRYIGYSRNPERRFKQHFDGTGAKVTQDLKPRGVEITPHSTVAAAKKAETKTYYRQKKELGRNKVRGAGNTARFFVDDLWRSG